MTTRMIDTLACTALVALIGAAVAYLIWMRGPRE
jgi:hypothetical protein